MWGWDVIVSMKILRVAAGTLLLTWGVAGFAQTDVRCGQVLEAPLKRGAELKIDSVPAGVEIVGTDQEGVRVSCSSDDANVARDVRMRVSGTAERAKVTITGGHLKNGNLRIRVEAPRKMKLGFAMAAGEVKVNEVVGDKEIALTAGTVRISSDHGWEYRDVDVSVGIGSVNAAVYGANKGGFFRAFRKEDASGEYRLHAHVTTGEIDLLGKRAGEGGRQD